MPFGILLLSDTAFGLLILNIFGIIVCRGFLIRNLHVTFLVTPASHQNLEILWVTSPKPHRKLPAEPLAEPRILADGACCTGGPHAGLMSLQPKSNWPKEVAQTLQSKLKRALAQAVQPRDTTKIQLRLC